MARCEMQGAAVEVQEKSESFLEPEWPRTEIPQSFPGALDLSTPTEAVISHDIHVIFS